MMMCCVFAENMSKIDEHSVSWYILKVISGREDSIRGSIEEAINVGEQSALRDIAIPAKNSHRVKAGKKIPIRKKLYPGYIMVQIMNSDLSDMASRLKAISGVLGIMGDADRPSPVPEKQFEAMMASAEKVDDDDGMRCDYEVGGEVRIVDGVFEGFTAIINEVDKEHERLSVTVSIFERETSVSLSFSQVAAKSPAES